MVDTVVVVVVVALSVVVKMGSAGEAVEVGTIGCGPSVVGFSFSDKFSHHWDGRFHTHSPLLSAVGGPVFVIIKEECVIQDAVALQMPLGSSKGRGVPKSKKDSAK